MPDHVGPYRLERVLGAGGMGVVHLARGPDGTPVAIKLINEELREDPAFRRRFAREVAAARRVAAFCTARVLAADLDCPIPYLVTEYIAGPSLYAHVTANGPLSDSEVETLAVGVAAALTSIHAAGLVHGDLTPRNVMLSAFGPKVVDFGVARPLDDPDTTGQTIGTPGWMAPERLAGRPPAASADVYAWSMLVRWAATGRHPALTTVDPSRLPAPLAAMVEQAFAADPDQRPAARAVLLALTGSDDPAPATLAVRPAEPAAIRVPPPGPAATRPLPSGPAATRALPPGPAATRVLSPAPVANRLRRLLMPAAVPALIAVLLGVSLSRDGDARRRAAPPSASAAAPPQATPAAPPQETPSDPASAAPGVRAGALRFTVTGLHCGATEMGFWPVERKAKGHYCVVDLTVTNVGQDGTLVWVLNQHLEDAGGRSYSPDAWSLLSYPQTLNLIREVQPGDTVSGALIYDVPRDTEVKRLVLHDGLTGAGVPVDLG
ncbi:serine/threonine-protein kinase [Actinoplanes sp. N902-109]|uniref:serine/threonine-protein kinase n=1 Tax=Actinoplanes sp. (strain N902-109) TaxID=649831 RepID=UPI001E33E2DD|nr:serine/threonine-protein kinase [Actinoplanes sp. N902-109]